MNNSQDTQASDGDHIRSPTSPVPLSRSSSTSLPDSPILPTYSQSGPWDLLLPVNSRRKSSTESVCHRTERTTVHPRGKWKRSSTTGEYISETGYKWDDGESMRSEDDNLLAACSEPILPNLERQAQSSKLLDLPVEMQNEILRNVDRSDFKALSKTCVALRAAVVPLILEHAFLSRNSPRCNLVVETLEAAIKKSKDTAGMIRNIHFLDDDTISDILSRLLPFTSKLKSLHYEYVVFEGRDENDIIEARRLSSSLHPVRHTLTDLKIGYVHQMSVSEDRWSACVDGWLCVKEMVALKRLETTITILLGPTAKGAPGIADILPPGLVELKVLSDPWDKDPARWTLDQRIEVIAEYVRDKNWTQFTPNLRLLNYNMHRFRGFQTPGIDTVAAEEALAQLVGQNGLEWGLEKPWTPPRRTLI